VAIGVFVGLLLAGGAVVKVHKQWTSAAWVSVLATGVNSTNQTGGRTSGTVNLDTEAQIVKSGTIATAAAKLMKVPADPTTLANLTNKVTVTVPPNSTILAIACTQPNPQLAVGCAHAFAEAYLTARTTAAQGDLNAQIKLTSDLLTSTQAEISRYNGKLSSEQSNSPTFLDDQAAVATLHAQAIDLTKQLDAIKTTPVNAGAIISDATPPTSPSSPQKTIFLGAGLMVGLLLGLGAALLRARRDRRVHDPEEFERETGLEVLANLPDRGLDNGKATQAIVHLRNAVSAAIAPEHRVLLVTSATPGQAAGAVATSLSRSLARSGSTVTLVHVDPAGYDGPAERPGLADVLVDGGQVPAMLLTDPEVSRLRVLGPGRDPDRVGPLLETSAVRVILGELLGQAEYVVMSAPATSQSADAQTLARLADGALLVVQRQRATSDDVDLAVHQFHQVGVTLVGAVLVPRRLDARNKRPDGGHTRGRQTGTGGPRGDLADDDSDAGRDVTSRTAVPTDDVLPDPALAEGRPAPRA
jgi:capsular polysaccharide biosynthesis protein/Mrp family chromosome partitioning ATPase